MNPDQVGNKLFYDTYALYAIAQGNKNYARFVKDKQIVTTLFNLYELYYSLIRDGEDTLAENFFERLLNNCRVISPDQIKKAARFRLLNKRFDLSYVDCIGYIIAKEVGIPFLTGDKGFGKLDNVFFVQ